jgi:hypothetical protein
MYWLILPWAVAILWIGAGEWTKNHVILKNTTQETLRGIDSIIQAYTSKYGEAPPSLNQLRLYSKMRGRPFSSVDSWGGRLEYLRLGKVNYTIRSFGEDGVQNTHLTEPDTGIFRWGQMMRTGLQYDYDVGIRQARPSVVLFAGADDNAREWHAKLFLDPETGSRRLLIRSKKVLNLYMLAPHDGIEEFLWLPEGDRIVYTATGSARYSDGVWIWDLKTDQAWNLLEFNNEAGDLSPTKKAKSLHLALSYVASGVKTSIGVFIAPSSGQGMDAESFFHPMNRFVFEMGSGTHFKRIDPTDNSKKEESLFDYEWMGQSALSPRGSGISIQRSWLRLPRAGDWERGMGSWQDFAAEHAQSPLAAYAVWALALFYQDGALAAKKGSKEAIILRGYSMELSLAVSRMIAAPSWMRAAAVSFINSNQ